MLVTCYFFDLLQEKYAGPKAVHVLLLLFHLFNVRCCSISKCLNLTLLCVQLFYSVKVTELSPVWEKAANSAYHLLFPCLLKYVVYFSL